MSACLRSALRCRQAPPSQTLPHSAGAHKGRPYPPISVHAVASCSSASSPQRGRARHDVEVVLPKAFARITKSLNPT